MKRTLGRILLAAIGLLAACATPRPAAPTDAPPPSVAPPTAPKPLAAPSGTSVLIAAPGPQHGSYHIWAVDPGNGTALSEGAIDYMAPGRSMGLYAFSPDGETLAVATGSSTFCSPSGVGTACSDAVDTIVILDLSTGQADQIPLLQPSVVSLLAFSSTGTRLAMAVQDKDGFHIAVVDVSQARFDGQAALPVDPSALAYAADGRSLMVFGSIPAREPGLSPPGPAEVLILGDPDLSILWRHSIDGLQTGSWCLSNCGSGQEASMYEAWYPAFAHHPGSDQLLLLHPEASRLTIVDAGRRLVESLDIAPAKTWLDRLMAWGTSSAEAKGWAEGGVRQAVLSPDGTRLFTLGTLLHARTNQDGSVEGWEEPLGLDVVDPTNGVQLAHLATKASAVRLSVDGRWLLLERGESFGLVTDIVDAQSLQQVASFEDWQLLPIRSLEGESLLLATSQGVTTTRFALIDPSTMQRSSAWTLDGFVAVISP